MKIDRHNYEEFFILYMDNELNSEDRRMVEAFVQQNPDLKEELDTLLQYKLNPDTSVIYNGKEELMKVNGDTPITLSNYEEWLTLYIDNELTVQQKESVEEFIATSPAAERELALLLKTRMHPETIIFTNKESLYRNEEKVRPIPFRWQRFAVAAILLLAVGLTAVFIFNKKSSNSNPDIAKTPGTEQKNPVQTNVAKQNEQSNNTTPEEPVINNREAVVNNNNIKQSFTPVEKHSIKNVVVKSTDNKKPSVNKKIQTALPVPIKNQDEMVADNNNKPSNNLPQPLYNPNVIKTDATNPVVAETNIPKEISNPLKELTNNDAVTNIIPASYNNSKQLEEGGKNKKNRGIFRKLARTFEKRTNMTATDGDRLLVGGLSIKLK